MIRTQQDPPRPHGEGRNRNGGESTCFVACTTTSFDVLRSTGATGPTPGTIEWCLRRFTCILQSTFGPKASCVSDRRMLMHLSSILPALAFSLDMFDRTMMSYGVNEVLLSSVLGAVVFSIFAAQPLVIVGVTGMHLRT